MFGNVFLNPLPAQTYGLDWYPRLGIPDFPNFSFKLKYYLVQVTLCLTLKLVGE